MGIRAASPRQGRWTRAAALLAAIVTAFSVAAPGALAAPTPPLPTNPQGVELVIPVGGSPSTDQELEEAARRLLASPYGQELTKERIRLGTNDGPGDPGNVAVTWFDLNWMHGSADLPGWLPADKLYAFLLQALNLNVSNTDISGNYKISTRSLDHAANARLLDALGVPKNGRLLQVATSNVLRGTHSERIAIIRFQQAVARVIRSLSPRIQTQAQIDALVEKILQKSSAAVASENSPCLNACDKATAYNRHRFAISHYGYGSTADSRRSTANVRNVMGKAKAQLTRERSKAAQAKINKNLGLPPDCEPTKSLGRPGGGMPGGRAMAMTAVPLAAAPLAAAPPCPEGSPLGKALAANDYGGVDFSSLQMRYMSDNPGGGGVQYSFAGQAASPSLQQDTDSGLAAVADSTADLRTWLVLDPAKFWVNLNPSEPNRIVDPRLGRTNAGRALLEADLEMKRTQGKLIDPKTEFGARYWDALLASNGPSCFASRMWIVPGDVQVREDGGSLYILNAALDVKAKTEHLAGMSCPPNPAADARRERLEREMVLPRIVKAVNTAPEYAPIRRAFLARVVAQWIRKRHQEGHRTSFDRLIDSGDVGPAELEGGWKPRQVFDRYVQSIRSGEYTYKRTSQEGGNTVIRTMVFGGVDFGKIKPTAVSAAQMDQRHPRLPQTVRTSRDRPATAPDGSIWLGETAGTPDDGLLSRATGSLRSLAGGRTGLVVVLVVALLAVTFGIRGGGGRRRTSS